MTTAACLAMSLPNRVAAETPSQRKQRMTTDQLRKELSGKRQNPEAKLHEAVIEYLRLVLPKGAVIHHSPNEGKRGWLERAALKNNGTMAGWPDIEILWNGRIFFIELKSDKGRITPEQDACHAAIANAGARVTVARSIQHVIDALALWGIPTRAAQSCQPEKVG